MTVWSLRARLASRLWLCVLYRPTFYARDLAEWVWTGACLWPWSRPLEFLLHRQVLSVPTPAPMWAKRGWVGGAVMSGNRRVCGNSEHGKLAETPPRPWSTPGRGSQNPQVVTGPNQCYLGVKFADRDWRCCLSDVEGGLITSPRQKKEGSD